jgi:hypothetical protein
MVYVGRGEENLQETHLECPNAELNTPSRGDHALFQGNDNLGTKDAVLDVGRVGEDRVLLLKRVQVGAKVGGDVNQDHKSNIEELWCQ